MNIEFLEPASLDRAAECGRRGAQSRNLGIGEVTLGDAVVETDVAPPFIANEDGHERGGKDVFIGEVLLFVRVRLAANGPDHLVGGKRPHVVVVPLDVGPSMVIGHIDRRCDARRCPFDDLVHAQTTLVVGHVAEDVDTACLDRLAQFGQDAVGRIPPGTGRGEALGGV